MQNLRELSKNASHINVYSELLYLYEALVTRYYNDLNEFVSPTIYTAFDSSIEKILKEIAILRMNEMEEEQATIEANAINEKAWGALERMNEELYYLLLRNYLHVREEYFSLGFREGYKIRK